MQVSEMTGTLFVGGEALETLNFTVHRWPNVIAATFFFKSKYFVGHSDNTEIRLDSGEVLPIEIVLQKNENCRAEWIGVQVQGDAAKDFWYKLAA